MTGNELMAMWWAQNQFNPIIEDGLVFYAPMNRLERTAYTGQVLNYAEDAVILRDDGIDGLVGYVNTDLLDLSAIKSVTLSVWVKIYSWVTWEAVFGLTDIHSSVENPGIRIGFPQKKTNETWVYFQQHENYYTYIDNIMGAWKHNLVIFDHNARKMAVYSNGTLINNKNVNFQLNLSENTRIYTGMHSGKTTINVCGLRLYNRVLNSDEISALANEFHPVTN